MAAAASVSSTTDSTTTLNQTRDEREKEKEDCWNHWPWKAVACLCRMQILKRKLVISQISCLPVWTAVFIPRIWANEFLYIPDFAFYNWIDFERFHSYRWKKRKVWRRCLYILPRPQPVWIQFGIVKPKDMKLSGLSLAFWMEGHPDSYTYLIYLLISWNVAKNHTLITTSICAMKNTKHINKTMNEIWKSLITIKK